jgi:hypothetical protein
MYDWVFMPYIILLIAGAVDLVSLEKYTAGLLEFSTSSRLGELIATRLITDQNNLVIPDESIPDVENNYQKFSGSRVYKCDSNRSLYPINGNNRNGKRLLLCEESLLRILIE